VLSRIDNDPAQKHSIATHFLDAGADVAFVQEWVGHTNIQHTTIDARLATATLDRTARQGFASHRVVSCLLVSGSRGGTLSCTACLCPTLAPLHTVADEAGHTEADQQQDTGIGLWHTEALVWLRVLLVRSIVVLVIAWLCGVTHGRREYHQSQRAQADADRPS
jgi:hypothetical protein